MAKRKKTKKKSKQKKRKWLAKALMIVCVPLGISIYLVFLFAVFNPDLGLYASSEARRLGGIKHQWVDIEQVAPSVARSVVAAEDANFCLHYGFDIEAIRDAINDGGTRGGSGITQQVAKNVYLWNARSYLRKGLETGFTILIEAIWSKQRILEVYLNVAEFDEGVFGIEAASQHHYGVSANKLSERQASLLAAVLPNPKARSATRPSSRVNRRAGAVLSGARTIAADGRADCFEKG